MTKLKVQIKSGDTLSGIIKREMGVSAVKSGKLAVEGAKMAGLVVHDLTAWASKFQKTPEKICDGIKQRARKYSCNALEFVKIVEGQWVVAEL